MNESPDDIDFEGDEKPRETKSARAYLAALREAEKQLDDYNAKADNIDKMYADLERLAKDYRDREFQLFWANIQVLGPSIYARPPVPVVVPKFKDRRPLYRVASELLERSVSVAFDVAPINDLMLLLRDDLTIVARGVPWVRYETKEYDGKSSERLCFDHKDRRDFLHEPARNWMEVGWVAAASHLTKKEMRKRFSQASGDAYKSATYSVMKEDRANGGAGRGLKCKVWEIWHKTDDKVIWVTEGVDVVLEEGKPHLKLDGFFPCPRPAYATVQRRSLIPVPDMVYYKDQLEEINELTGRIHALSEAVQVRGFYPAGAGEIGDAIESALKTHNNRQVMVPISNWAAFGNGSAKDTIVWLPIDQIVTTVAQLVELRRQVIDDVYQIMGLSDIMRGSTEKDETLGAQELKAQFGSVRIRDKQAELVRVARDMVRIAAEIMAENFSQKTLLEMSQMEIPSDRDIARQIKAIEQGAQKEFDARLQEAMSDPELMQQAQADPAQAQQMAAQVQLEIIGRAQQEIAKLEETPTIEKVVAFLRDQRVRPFVLDIETDSTIQPDEDAEKQRRGEFLTALGTTMRELAGLVQMEPSAAGFAAEVLKFAVAPFRAGRELEGAIEEFAEQMKQRAANPPPNPEAEAAKTEAEAAAQRLQAEMQMKMQELEAKASIEREKLQADMQAKQMDAEAKAEENRAKLEQISAQMRRDEQKGALEVQKLQMELRAKAAELQMKAESAQIDASLRQQQAAQQADQSERAFQQKSALTQQQAEARQANGIGGGGG